MKNVTITLDEKVAQWARVEAAKAGKSLSRWLGDWLAEKRDQATASSTTGDWLEVPLWPSAPGAAPTRTELYEAFYDRPGFRGHERADLQPGRERPEEGSHIGGMAEEAPAGWPDPEPSGSE